MPYSKMCTDAVKVKGPNMTVPWVLMAAYAYYHLDTTIITDGCYDQTVTTMKTNWNVISHRHKPLLEKYRNSEMSSLYDLPEHAYPLIVRNSTSRLVVESKIPIKRKRK